MPGSAHVGAACNNARSSLGYYNGFHLIESIQAIVFTPSSPQQMPVLSLSVSNFRRISDVFLGGWDRCLGWALFLCPPRWMEACLEEELPPTTELEEGLRNGVYLGKLATFFAPKMVSEKRIYDRDQSRYKVCVCVCVFWLMCSTRSVMSHFILVSTSRAAGCTSDTRTTRFSGSGPWSRWVSRR